MNELKLGGRNKLCLHDVTMHKMLQKCLDNRKQKICQLVNPLNFVCYMFHEIRISYFKNHTKYRVIKSKLGIYESIYVKIVFRAKI